MEVFRPFEIEAIRLLADGVLDKDVLNAIETSSEPDGFEYTGSGYFLSVRHPLLPTRQMTLADPPVLGTAGEIQAGFIVFLGEGRLTLECHTWGPIDVPSNFRDSAVSIRTQTL